MPVPVIDLFAGPGGLGEGFSKEESVQFEVAVSIEKDEMAHLTLQLRAAHRALRRDRRATAATWAKWDKIVHDEPWNVVIDQLHQSDEPCIVAAVDKARSETICLELGRNDRAKASDEIRQRLLPYMTRGQLPKNGVLIGGPPCQAYSIVGRSRNKGKENYKPEEDHRHFLYQEYLHVIEEFRPAVFVMENVKGILTSRVAGRQIFPMILRDLKRPDIALETSSPVEYVLLPLGESDSLIEDAAPSEFLLRAEDYGVPQARHRVIILGVRKDVFDKVGSVKRLRRSSPPSVSDVISGLPPLRPQISYRGKGSEWRDAFCSPTFDRAIKELSANRGSSMPTVAARLEKLRAMILERKSELSPGADRAFQSTKVKVRKPRKLGSWYQDRKSLLLANHESRAHMPSDLIRYLFVAAFGEVTRSSPRLSDFPKCLLPSHANVNPLYVEESIFKDRFRVQLAGRHSMTVTSHIAKDGHAFIHPQARQCRSLTVREAARLQTFPDSYVFLGNRTSQYTQVGNAVPPYLASQIARVVADILVRAGMA